MAANVIQNVISIALLIELIKRFHLFKTKYYD